MFSWRTFFFLFFSFYRVHSLALLVWNFIPSQLKSNNYCFDLSCTFPSYRSGTFCTFLVHTLYRRRCMSCIFTITSSYCPIMYHKSFSIWTLTTFPDISWTVVSECTDPLEKLFQSHDAKLEAVHFHCLFSLLANLWYRTHLIFIFFVRPSSPRIRSCAINTVTLLQSWILEVSWIMSVSLFCWTHHCSSVPAV